MMKPIEEYYRDMGGQPQFFHIFLQMLDPDRLTSAPGVTQLLTDKTGRHLHGIWYKINKDEHKTV